VRWSRNGRDMIAQACAKKRPLQRFKFSLILSFFLIKEKEHKRKKICLHKITKHAIEVAIEEGEEKAIKGIDKRTHK